MAILDRQFLHWFDDFVFRDINWRLFSILNWSFNLSMKNYVYLLMLHQFKCTMFLQIFLIPKIMWVVNQLDGKWKIKRSTKFIVVLSFRADAPNEFYDDDQDVDRTDWKILWIKSSTLCSCLLMYCDVRLNVQIDLYERKNDTKTKSKRRKKYISFLLVVREQLLSVFLIINICCGVD